MPEVRTIPVSDRQRLARLLDLRSAEDAMAAYYALEHPADRVSLFALSGEDGSPRAFLSVARTGLDLFRPLLVPFAATAEGLRRLLRDAMPSGQPFLLCLPAEQLQWVESELEIESADFSELLRLDASAYEPILNVLVVEAEAGQSLPRYEIHNASGKRAAAGVNWQGSRFAEVYLEADDAARGSGLTKSVLSAVAGRLLGEQRIALYRVPVERISQKTEAFKVGFRPTGSRRIALASASVVPQAERVL